MIASAGKQKRNCGDGLTAANLRALVRQQDHRCALTGRELTPQIAAMDHIMPISRGGEHSISNVWIVHMDVNRAKGVMTYEEFLAMCREVVAMHEARHAPYSGDGTRTGGESPTQGDAPSFGGSFPAP